MLLWPLHNPSLTDLLTPSAFPPDAKPEPPPGQDRESTNKGLQTHQGHDDPPRSFGLLTDLPEAFGRGGPGCAVGPATGPCAEGVAGDVGEGVDVVEVGDIGEGEEGGEE